MLQIEKPCKDLSEPYLMYKALGLPPLRMAVNQ